MWAAVLIGSMLAYGQKLLGYAIPQRALDGPRSQSAIVLLPLSMLAALVAVQTFGSASGLVLDARFAGLLAAAAALMLRAPFLVVVLTAAAVAAGLRALGVAA